MLLPVLLAIEVLAAQPRTLECGRDMVGDWSRLSVVGTQTLPNGQVETTFSPTSTIVYGHPVSRARSLRGASGAASYWIDVEADAVTLIRDVRRRHGEGPCETTRQPYMAPVVCGFRLDDGSIVEVDRVFGQSQRATLLCRP